MNSLPDDAASAGPLAVLSRFRLDFHACLTARRAEIFELADAVLCAEGPVRNLAALSLAPEHRRGHGALYDAVNLWGARIAPGLCAASMRRRSAVGHDDRPCPFACST